MSRSFFVAVKTLCVVAAFLCTIFSVSHKVFAQTNTSDWRVEYYRKGSEGSLLTVDYEIFGNYAQHVHQEIPYYFEWNEQQVYPSPDGSVQSGIDTLRCGAGLTYCDVTNSFSRNVTYVAKLIWNRPNINPPATVWVEETGSASWSAYQGSSFPDCFVPLTATASITGGDYSPYGTGQERSGGVADIYRVFQADCSSGVVILPPVNETLSFYGHASVGSTVGHQYPSVTASLWTGYRVRASANEPGRVNIKGVYEGQIVSGTDAPSISFTASGSSDDQKVTSMTCKIGGQIVAKYPNTSDPRYSSESSSSSLVRRVIETWATTHFDNETTIPIFVEATFSDGSPPQNKTVNVKIINKAYILGNHTLWGGAHPDLVLVPVSGEHTRMKHRNNGVDGKGSNGDDKTIILSSLSAFTSFYIYTHSKTSYSPKSSIGNPGANDSGFLDCFYDYVPSPTPDPNLPPHFVSASDVYNSLSNPNTGKGKDAKNIPPYNLVFIDGCDSAQYPSIAKAFGILQEGPPGHAMLGWKESLEDCERNRSFTKRLYKYLADGYDITVSKSLASKDFPPVIHQNKPAETGPETPATLVILGDKTMKLNSAPRGFPNSLPQNGATPVVRTPDWFFPALIP